MTLSSKDMAAFLKRYPIAIGCGVLSVILLAGAYIRSDRTTGLAKQSREGEEQGKKILKEIRDGANLAEQYEALIGHTKELESRLVLSSERARNQQYFYRIESETGVKEISLQPGARSTGPQRGSKTLYAGIGYSISVQGDYHQILDFLGRIESGQHFYRLISGSVSRAGQRSSGSAASLITLTLNLELLGLP
jgi:Tfp pilus assembly protein PilO